MSRSRLRRVGALIASAVLVVSGWPGLGWAQPQGAQGFGASTPGGAGATVVHVTTLVDGGKGSLREALRHGNRTIVFDVAGEIALTTHLYVGGPFVTIDGLSAPPPGITLRGHGLIIRGNRGSHDVIVRGIRVRDSAIDGIQVAYGAYNILIDRVSVAGALDGNIDITEGSHDVTVSWSIIGNNKKSMLIKYHPSRITLHHNVLVGSLERSPQVRVDDSETAVATETTADLRNNLVANWHTGYGTLVWYGAWANVVNNVYASAKHRSALKVQSARAFVAGNVFTGELNLNHQGTEHAPFPAPPVDIQDACAAARLVLGYAGVRPLDALDVQLLSGISLAPCPGLPLTIVASPAAPAAGSTSPASPPAAVTDSASPSAAPASPGWPQPLVAGPTASPAAVGGVASPQPLVPGSASSPVLVGSPASLTFRVVANGPKPPEQMLKISTEGPAGIAFTASAATWDGGPWLAVTPATGTAPGQVVIEANPAGLPAGTYPATVTLSAPGWKAPPLSIPVELVVAPAPGQGGGAPSP